MVEEEEVIDPDYGNAESNLRKRAKMQALIFKYFWKRWKLEYLTSL